MIKAGAFTIIRGKKPEQVEMIEMWGYDLHKERSLDYSLPPYFMFFFYWNLTVLKEGYSFFVLSVPSNIYYFQRLLRGTILFTKYVLLPAIRFYIQKQVTTPSLYSHVRQVLRTLA